MYWIVTDSTCDMPKFYIDAQEHLKMMNMSYIMDGESYIPDGTDENSRAIYKALRDGKTITTAQINVESWKACFVDLMEKGEDALAIIFSSGLSGTFMSAKLAAEEVRVMYPGRTLEVIDSYCASMGEGLLVDYVLKNRAAGMSVEDNAKWVLENRQNIIHWFTVDDLHFLHRGGRVSAASAYVGSIVKIKLILHVDFEGRLIPREKVQGRKKSIHVLAEKFRQFAVKPEEQTIFISHGDCPEDAALLEKLVREIGVKDVLTGYIGPIVGSHAGPGTLAIFFMGNGR